MRKPNHHPVNREGLVLWLDYMNSGSVSALGTVKDYSGNGNDGTCNGDAYVDNQGMNFDGSSDLINIADDPSLNFNTGAFTTTAVINPEVISTLGGRIIDKRGVGAFGAVVGYMVKIYAANGYWEFFDTAVDDGAGNYINIGYQGSRYDLGESYHIAVVYDPPFLRGYVNGELDASDSATVGSLDNTKTLYIGSGATTQRYKGTINNVQIYNRALSAGEIKANYLKNRRS